MNARELVLTLVALVATSVNAQSPLLLDTNFRTDFQSWYVNSIMQLADGDLIISGRIRLDGEWSDRGLVKVDPNTGAYLPVPGVVLVGGGKLTRWGEKYYVGAGQTLRRLNGDGLRDTTFISPDIDPTFGSLQGGDYHVYPDGRVLLTGFHQLLDGNANWIMHSLIWLTDSGTVDYGQTHRRSSAPISKIAEEPDGQFLCFYSGTEYEGQATNGRIFRIHADGTLDTTLHTQVSGTIFSLLPMDDGRFYASGKFYKSGYTAMFRLARFLPNGDLDPTFDNYIDFDRGDIPGDGTGATVGPLQFWRNGVLVVPGTYRFVNDEPRGSLCMIDSTGQLLDAFAGCATGPYDYFEVTYASVAGYLETPYGMAYIWGAYHGYNDGSTNDTLQRFVSRLYGPDWPTAVRESVEEVAVLSLHPNPTQGQITVTLKPGTDATHILLRDATGRVMVEHSLGARANETRLDVGSFASGCYFLEVLKDGERVAQQRLVLQP